MSYRWIVALMASVVLVGGCSSTKDLAPKPRTASPNASAPASGSASAPSSSESSAPSESESPKSGASLDAEACIKIGSAVIELVSATSKDEARKAADTLEKYNPPADVREAIEHFVDAGGLQSDDPDLEAKTLKIKDWVEQVCVT